MPRVRYLAVVLLLGAACPALATSIARAPQHDPTLACEAIKALVAGLATGTVADIGAPSGFVTFFSDALGKIEGEAEKTAFLAALHEASGKPDRRPLRLYHAYSMRSDEEGASYLVALERQRWTLVRDEVDDMLMPIEVPDPHYETTISYWIATFSSNSMWQFREAGELYRFMAKERQLPGC